MLTPDLLYEVPEPERLLEGVDAVQREDDHEPPSRPDAEFPHGREGLGAGRVHDLDRLQGPVCGETKAQVRISSIVTNLQHLLDFYFHYPTTVR